MSLLLIHCNLSLLTSPAFLPSVAIILVIASLNSLKVCFLHSVENKTLRNARVSQYSQYIMYTTIQLWNSLPSYIFPRYYDLFSFKHHCILLHHISKIKICHVHFFVPNKMSKFHIQSLQIIIFIPLDVKQIRSFLLPLLC